MSSNLIIEGLITAVATLFGLYSEGMRRRNKGLEDDLAARDETIKALEKENKRYQAIMITAGDEPGGLQKMRDQLGRELRESGS